MTSKFHFLVAAGLLAVGAWYNAYSAYPMRITSGSSAEYKSITSTNHSFSIAPLREQDAVPVKQDTSLRQPSQKSFQEARGDASLQKKTTELLQVMPCPRLGNSQGNQDCIIEKIFAAVHGTNRFYVEYGFNTNVQCSSSGPNTCRLWKSGLWKGLLLDGSHQNETINLHAHYLYANNIVPILEKYNVPKEVDYFSSDMDSHDYFVLKSVLESGKFRPRVISAEYNSNWPIDWSVSQIDPTIAYPDQEPPPYEFQKCVWGASAAALRHLMERHGYSLVAVTHLLDVFYVRNDVLKEAGYQAPPYDEVIKGSVGHSLHDFETNALFLNKLVDVQVYEETKNFTQANRAIVERILEHVKAIGQPTIPCLANVRRVEIEEYLTSLASA